MRLPRLRLPVPSLDWVPNVVSRPLLLYTVYTLVLFGVFVVLTFPHELVVRRALERTQNPLVSVDISGARFAWLNGYELQGLRLTPLPLREGVPPVLEWTRLLVRPQYQALLKGNLSTFFVSGELYGGSATGSWSAQNGGGALANSSGRSWISVATAPSPCGSTRVN